jgi:hypothetical protein
MTDPGVRFRNNFSLVVDVGELTNSPSACGQGAPHPNLTWDLITAVNEIYATPGGPLQNDQEHVDTLLNTGCVNPTTAKGGGRISFIAIDLRPTENGDSVYAKLLDSLLDDLVATRALFACTTTDGDALPPLSASVCSSLASREANIRSKLNSCIVGSMFPKQSQAINNCNAARQQMLNYQQEVNAAVRLGEDRADRIGDMKGRILVWLHVNDDHFLPSIPPQGFLDQFVP